MSSATANDFQIGAECLIKANKEYWRNESNITNGEDWIYVLHTLHHQFTVCLLENITAKGVQQKERLPIASIISGSADELMTLVDRMDESFGIEVRSHRSYYDYNSEEIEELAQKMSLDTYGEKDGLIALTYRGIKFGEVLYDDILRRGNSKKRGDIYDCFDICQERYCRFIRNALAIIDQAYTMFEKRKPHYFVTMEYYYTKGLYAHVAKALGAKIILPTVNCPSVVLQVPPDGRQLSDIKISDALRVTQEKCLQSYQSHNMGLENLFVLESEEEKTDPIPAEWMGKKNIFILPHALSDATREACRHNIYHDYNEWFLDTIRIIRNIPDVNWIIKDHPVSALYGQEDYVRSIFEKNKTDNMYWMDKNFSGMRIKDFADAVITCAGDAGIEYWAYGIPTITAAEAYYCRWGISYQMKTLDEYENALANIKNICKPSQQSVEAARRYLGAYKYLLKQNDVFSKLIFKSRSEEVAAWIAYGVPYGVKDSADQQLGKAARNFCESFAALLRENDLKSSAAFRLDNLAEV